MNTDSLEIIFSSFGSRSNANQPKHWVDNFILDPTYSSVKTYFPEAKITFYTDNPLGTDKYKDINVKVIQPNELIQTNHHRWGINNADYYQIQGLLNSTADIAISVDSDLMFVSDEVRTILPIIKKFGLCAPTNVRQLVKVDAIYTRGNDGDYHMGEDESNGNILTYDLWWNGFYTKDKRGRILLEEFARLMKENPRRSPLQYTRAAWNTGIHPYSMPVQWGVGQGHEGCGNEIILHVGHDIIQDYYLEERI
jgi:hypothetical protein